MACHTAPRLAQPSLAAPRLVLWRVIFDERKSNRDCGAKNVGTCRSAELIALSTSTYNFGRLLEVCDRKKKSDRAEIRSCSTRHKIV